VHALNTQYGGFVLATGGLATQALPLVRRGVEDWLAWWYLQVRPEQAVRVHIRHGQAHARQYACIGEAADLLSV